MANFVKAYWISLVLVAVFTMIFATIYIYANNIVYEASSDLAVIWVGMQIFGWLFFNLFTSIIVGIPVFFIVNIFIKFNFCWAVITGVLAAMVNYGVLYVIAEGDVASQWALFIACGAIIGCILGGIQIYYQKRAQNRKDA